MRGIGVANWVRKSAAHACAGSRLLLNIGIDIRMHFHHHTPGRAQPERARRPATNLRARLAPQRHARKPTLFPLRLVGRHGFRVRPNVDRRRSEPAVPPLWKRVPFLRGVPPFWEHFCRVFGGSTVLKPKKPRFHRSGNRNLGGSTTLALKSSVPLFWTTNSSRFHCSGKNPFIYGNANGLMGRARGTGSKAGTADGQNRSDASRSDAVGRSD